ncbi:MAG: dockerin type I repeat-containing protein [Candidatus Hydrogenedentota bacterium]
MFRSVTALLLAAVLLAAAGLSVPGRTDAVGDANGDGTVDVRDLQLIVARVLAGESDDPRADVNQDGRVDVLDFQCALGQARATHPEEHPQRQDHQEAVVLARVWPPAIPAGVPQIRPITPGKRVTTAALRARSVPKRQRSARRERYTQRLTPNAPPRTGAVCPVAA